jgi:hypothetical protein
MLLVRVPASGHLLWDERRTKSWKLKASATILPFCGEIEQDEMHSGAGPLFMERRMLTRKGLKLTTIVSSPTTCIATKFVAREQMPYIGPRRVIKEDRGLSGFEALASILLPYWKN